MLFIKHLVSKGVLLVLLLFLLIKCFSGVIYSDLEVQKANYELNLVYEAYTWISAEGSYLEEILGLPDNSIVNSVIITVNYMVFINVTLNAYLEVENYSLLVLIKSITITPSNDITEQLKLRINSINGTEVTICTTCRSKILGEQVEALPLLLSIEKGTPVLKRIPERGVLIALTRLDIDLAVSRVEVRVEEIDFTNYTRKDLYYEPLTGIPVHYSEVLIYRSIYEYKSYTYMAYVTLLDYSRHFKNYINRRVADIIISNNSTTTPLTLLILYPIGFNLIDVNTIDHDVIVVFNTSTRCFIQLGPLSPQLNITVNGAMFKYYRTLEGLVAYTPTTMWCSLINISLPAPLEESKEQEFPEKGLPPQVAKPTITDIAFSLSLVFLMLLVSYIAIRKIVNYFVKSRS